MAKENSGSKAKSLRREPLSPEEIESLGGDPTRQRAESLVGATVRPEQAHFLQAIAEQFSLRLTDAASALLRTEVQSLPYLLERQTLGQFFAGLDNTGCRGVLRVVLPEGRLVLDIAPELLHAMLDCLLGGDPRRAAPARRPLTEIELRLATRILHAVVAELRGVWSDVEIELIRVDTEPRQHELFPPDEPLALVRFELVLGPCRGPITLAIPLALVDRCVELLADVQKAAAASGSGPASRAGQEETEAADQGRLVEIRARLARTRVTAAQLIDLGVGDILTTNQPADQPLTVEVDGRARFLARPGIHEGRKAVRVEKPIDPPEAPS